MCTSPPPPLVLAGGGEVDVLGGVEVGITGAGDVDEGGLSLPLARAALAGFDEGEGGAEGGVSTCAG